MRKLVKLCVVLLLLAACSTEQETQTRQLNNDNTITFEAFKSATGLNDFNKNIRIPKGHHGHTARNAAMEDFVIDTELIRKTIVNQRITYSFSIEPKVIKDKLTLYNLTVYYKGGSWQYAILEMKPSEATFQSLLSGQDVRLDGEIREIYHTDVSRGVDCAISSIENRHCTNTGPCATGPCDNCNWCVSYISFKICRYDSEDYNSFTFIAMDNEGGGGGGGAVINHDYVFTPNFGSYNIRTIRAERAANFYDVLEPEQQAWADSHADAYHELMEYYLDHYNTEEAGFAIIALQALMNNEEVDFPKNIIYAMPDKPCQTAIVKDVMDSCSPFTNLINNTFNVSEKVNLRYKNEDIPNGEPAGTNAIPLGDQGNYIIRISFDNTYLASATDLSIAAVTLHELVHAYLINLYVQQKLLAENTEYDTLLNAFFKYYANPTGESTNIILDEEIHNAMIFFIDKLTDSLYNYATSKNINASREYCNSLIWGTLNGTTIFNQELTTEQKQDYENIAAIEQDNLQSEDPKGTPCN
jgi:hypothetical protein